MTRPKVGLENTLPDPSAPESGLKSRCCGRFAGHKGFSAGIRTNRGRMPVLPSVAIPAEEAGESEYTSVEQCRIETRRCPPCLHEVSEDIAYLHRILDNRDNLHLTAALGAHQRIDLVYLRE